MGLQQKEDALHRLVDIWAAGEASAALGFATARFFDEKLAKMTPERAAEIILKGVLSNKARVLVGVDAHAMHHLAKLTGSRYQDLVARTSKKVLPH